MAFVEFLTCLVTVVASCRRCKIMLRRTQEGCGGLGAENPAAFPQARPIFQQPFSLPENAQTLAGIAFRAAGKSVKNFPAASKFAGKPFQQRISDSHSLLECSDYAGVTTCHGCWLAVMAARQPFLRQSLLPGGGDAEKSVF